MSLRLTCPGCGLVADIEAWLADGAAHEAIRLALRLPAGLADRLQRYLGLFRPLPGPEAGRTPRALALDRIERLLAELLPMIGAARVERHGRAWAAPALVWEQALDEILAKRHTLRLPLTSHGYLLEIVAGIAARAEGHIEAQREQQRAYPYSQPRQAEAGPVPLKQRMPESVREALRKPGEAS